MPEDQVAKQAQRAHLHDLVRALPSEHQELVALKFGAGLSNRQIAKLLDKSESGVGSTIHRIMQTLRLRWEVDNGS